MTENARVHVTAGDRFGRLRALRALGHGARTLIFCQCQRSSIVATSALLEGTARCPHCSPLLPEQPSSPRDEAAATAAESEGR
jgi:hypothetical protein